MAIQQMFLGVGAALEKPYFGDIGLWAGGEDVTASNMASWLEVSQYVSIPTTGNASVGGDLTTDKRNGGGCSNGSRAIYCAGQGSGGVLANYYYKRQNIDYQTISTQSDCQDFGDITTSTAELAACSNGTRGVIGGGETSSGRVSTIEYVVIDTTSGASNFGDLHNARYGQAGLSNGIRGIFAAGAVETGDYDQIEYITIDTNGNGTDLCDLNYVGYSLNGCGNRERSIVCMGRHNSWGGSSTNISYFDPTSTADAQDFGDLTTTRNQGVSLNNATRAVFGGGDESSTSSNTIDYITIASTGAASDFGDMNEHTRMQQGASGD